MARPLFCPLDKLLASRSTSKNYCSCEGQDIYLTPEKGCNRGFGRRSAGTGVDNLQGKIFRIVPIGVFKPS
jgi:hypothetical protein